MEIVLSQEQGRVPVTVFRVTGRVNLATAEPLQDKARETIQAGARDVLLDLSGVDSLTSAGLRAIHQIYQLLHVDSATAQSVGAAKSPHLKLLNPSPAVRGVLRIAGFDMFLEIHDDLKTAVASF
jgi:anti-anti-sigma factor